MLLFFIISISFFFGNAQENGLLSLTVRSSANVVELEALKYAKQALKQLNFGEAYRYYKSIMHKSSAIHESLAELELFCFNSRVRAQEHAAESKSMYAHFLLFLAGSDGYTIDEYIQYMTKRDDLIAKVLREIYQKELAKVMLFFSEQKTFKKKSGREIALQQFEQATELASEEWKRAEVLLLVGEFFFFDGFFKENIFEKNKENYDAIADLLIGDSISKARFVRLKSRHYNAKLDASKILWRIKARAYAYLAALYFMMNDYEKSFANLAKCMEDKIFNAFLYPPVLFAEILFKRHATLSDTSEIIEAYQFGIQQNCIVELQVHAYIRLGICGTLGIGCQRNIQEARRHFLTASVIAAKNKVYAELLRWARVYEIEQKRAVEKGFFSFEDIEASLGLVKHIIYYPAGMHCVHLLKYATNLYESKNNADGRALGYFHVVATTSSLPMVKAAALAQILGIQTSAKKVVTMKKNPRPYMRAIGI